MEKVDTKQGNEQPIEETVKKGSSVFTDVTPLELFQNEVLSTEEFLRDVWAE
jgi:hypothetical protein